MKSDSGRKACQKVICTWPLLRAKGCARTGTFSLIMNCPAEPQLSDFKAVKTYNHISTAFMSTHSVALLLSVDSSTNCVMFGPAKLNV